MKPRDNEQPKAMSPERMKAVMSKLSYPKAPQIEGNPKEAEHYIRDLVIENKGLATALRRIISLGDKNVPKYAKEIAATALRRFL